MRDLRFDIQKAVLMVFVMISHIIGHFNFMHILTIPAFVIIGSYFTKIKNEDNIFIVIKKRFYTIMSYYFIFSFISFVLYLSKNETTNILPMINYIFNGTVLNDISNENSLSINLPLWFLPFYFSVMSFFDVGLIISNKIYNKFKTKNIIIFNIVLLFYVLILTMIFYYYVIVLKKKPLIFHIDLACITLPLAYFGKVILPFFVKKVNDLKNIFLKNVIVLIIAITIFIIFYNYSNKIDYIDLYPRTFGNSFFIFLFLSMFSYLSLFLISDIIADIKYLSNILSFFGTISLYIMAYHMPSHLVFFNINFIFPSNVVWILTEYNKVLFNIFLIIYMFLFSAFMYVIHKSIKYVINNK